MRNESFGFIFASSTGSFFRMQHHPTSKLGLLLDAIIIKIQKHFLFLRNIKVEILNTIYRNYHPTGLRKSPLKYSLSDKAELTLLWCLSLSELTLTTSIKDTYIKQRSYPMDDMHRCR